MMKILAINPGSTSTKIGFFEQKGDKLALLSKTDIHHKPEEINSFEKDVDQYDYRKDIIASWLNENSVKISSISAFVGRGGFLMPIPAGVYKVNKLMKKHLKEQKTGEHVCNLGGLIAAALAEEAGHDHAYIVDPVCVDEIDDIARISGRPELPRHSKFHALNHRAVAEMAAEKLGKTYENCRFVITHAGGGISVASHKGYVSDNNNGLNGEGPFTPQRTGGLPSGDLVDLCFTADRTHAQMKKMIKGEGGLMALLNTTDCKEIEQKIENGDKYAKLIYDAMFYQIGKAMGEYAAVLEFKLDAFVITGGLAYGQYGMDRLRKMVEHLAPLMIFPGAHEEFALANGVFNGILGKRKIKIYTPEIFTDNCQDLWSRNLHQEVTTNLS